jgi:hypothetical protein
MLPENEKISKGFIRVIYAMRTEKLGYHFSIPEYVAIE